MTLAEQVAPYPPPRVIPGARERLRRSLVDSRTKLVVIDDDPTGTQTVHGVRVYMDWSVDTLRGALERAESMFYVSTNSRALRREQAERLAHELGRNLEQARRETGLGVIVASRSDSTLRGHFPYEVTAIASELVAPIDGVLLTPAFFEGGRYTIGGIHWVEHRGALVPAHETEFARDPDFGFHTSDLREWVQEKSGGAVRASQVIVVPLEVLRSGELGAVTELLLGASGGLPIAADAACYEDLELLALAVAEAERRGKRFVYRTAASFVKVRAGLEDRPLLTHEAIGANAGAGLVVVGSYVERTTKQLGRLFELPGVRGVELSVGGLLDDARRNGEIADAARAASRLIRDGVTAALFTTRGRLDATDFLATGGRIMESLCECVRRVDRAPAFVVAKGGITSIEIARSALGVSGADVLGQIARGVPLWRLDSNARWGSLPYVVFPGNVGDESTLADVVAELRGVRGATGSQSNSLEAGR